MLFLCTILCFCHILILPVAHSNLPPRMRSSAQLYQPVHVRPSSTSSFPTTFTTKSSISQTKQPLSARSRTAISPVRFPGQQTTATVQSKSTTRSISPIRFPGQPYTTSTQSRGMAGKGKKGVNHRGEERGYHWCK